MKKNIIYSMVVLLALVLVGCTVDKPVTGQVVSEEIVFDDDLFSEDAPVEDVGVMEETEEVNSEDVMEETEEEPMETEEEVEQAMEEDADVTLEVVEGDLVELNPKAEDPDGDELTFDFSDPLNENGKWQTNEGDAGKYLITVSATAGGQKTSQDVLLVVKPANKAPTVECPKDITVNEGDNVFIDCNIFDIDGQDSDIVVSFSGWMKTPMYETTYDDAGDHTVIIFAEDIEGKEASAEVKITVNNVNREPEFSLTPEDYIVMEGDLIALDYEAVDPDGDKLTYTFSEPFAKDGTWQTEIDDAGTYNAFVTVTDGEFTAKEEFEVVVQLVNTAPALKAIPDVYVKEGETVTIEVDATDREGDRLTVSYSGWMDEESRQTDFEDARPIGCNTSGCTAEYEVLVTVSDGFLDATQTVTVFVEDVDRAPVFKGILGGN